ncbi:MAG: hypothetical protein M3305_02005 [Actinomycetota bacterium]|nr:hypothetical protein [Actinomycetota bacterium]
MISPIDRRREDQTATQLAFGARRQREQAFRRRDPQQNATRPVYASVISSLAAGQHPLPERYKRPEQRPSQE